MSAAPDLETLRLLLEEAQDAGFVGPGPVEAQISHAEALAALIGAPGGDWLDLGSGGGLPGLVLALVWPHAGGVLLDGNGRRCEFLRGATDRLMADDRVQVLHERAEDAAHDPDFRGRFPLVVARSFGRPATTAECAVGFLQLGGQLVVSEPEGSDDGGRWPSAGLERLGLGPAKVEGSGTATIASMRLESGPEARWPRRVGVPAKRPLW